MKKTFVSKIFFVFMKAFAVAFAVHTVKSTNTLTASAVVVLLLPIVHYV